MSPLVWRRLLVPSDATISELHAVLQLAFGWSDDHLHRFVVHGREYAMSRPGGIGFRDDARRAAATLVDIPNLLGLQVTEATARLAQLGLKAAIQEQRSSTVPRGVVMGQDPPAGSRSAVGSQVMLALSSGP